MPRSSGECAGAQPTGRPVQTIPSPSLGMRARPSAGAHPVWGIVPSPRSAGAVTIRSLPQNQYLTVASQETFDELIFPGYVRSVASLQHDVKPFVKGRPTGCDIAPEQNARLSALVEHVGSFSVNGAEVGLRVARCKRRPDADTPVHHREQVLG